MTATDKDTGYNAIIHYGLTEATSFYLGELSGHITTLQPLDYENCAQHTIVLKAFNPGDPHFRDTANVTGRENLPQRIYPSFCCKLFQGCYA